MKHNLNLNSLITGNITEIAFGGAGLLKIDGFVIFVPFTAPGDVIEAKITELKKGFGRAELVRILTPSKLRTKPKCPYFGVCMGCQLQHIQYDAQLNIKKQAVKDSLSRIGKLQTPDISITASDKAYDYRERITLHLDQQKMGYIASDNKSILNIETCPIFTDEPFLQKLNRAASHEFKDQKGRLQVLKDQKGSFVVHASLDPKPKHFPADILFSKDEELVTSLLGLELLYSPKVFIQNNRYVSEKIYLEILNLVKELRPSKVLDLYSGIGITACLIAKENIPVTSIELNASSVTYAKKNRDRNHLKNITCLQGKAEEKLPNQSFDLVILNPPRVGCEKEVMGKIRDNIQPKTIIYVSCMPSTLARDLNILGNGYKINIAHAFDMFPQTGHIETLVRLERA